ncbi:MAG: response regulator transcription factor [Gammaproteobacteria bacterium]|nr:response regulator transcription factor [Gammaproteobacteria bacterium]
MKILICDDHALFRDGLKQLILQHNSAFTVIEAASMAEGRQQCEQHTFSLILLDLNMPGSNGVASLPEICSRTTAPVIVVSADDRNETIQMTVRQGVAGYLAKSSDSTAMISVIKKVLAGEKYFPAAALQANKHTAALSLNTRQIEILQCLVDGLSNKQIADKINLSEGTVRQYVTIILRTLGVDNRTQAANAGRQLLLPA